jgi:TPR repeat protein
MYHNGQGVPQNYGEAATWYRKAAEQGFAPAEVTLGVAYATGEGVPQSYSESYFWLKVAEAGNPEVKPEDLVTLLERIAAHLTAVEVAHAQARVREWLTGRK